MDAFLEPVIVFSILTAGVIFNRRRSTIVRDQRDGSWSPSSTSSSEGLLSGPVVEAQWRERKFLGKKVRSRNTIRWKNSFVSRILRKFPFLVEVWYWLLVYWVSTTIYLRAGDDLWSYLTRSTDLSTRPRLQRRYSTDRHCRSCPWACVITHSPRAAPQHLLGAGHSGVLPSQANNVEDYQHDLLIYPYSGDNYVPGMAVPLCAHFTVWGKKENIGGV